MSYKSLINTINLLVLMLMLYSYKTVITVSATPAEEDKNFYGPTGTIKKKKFDDLNYRCKIKRESNCDIFISIHQNFFPQPQYYGAQVWYSNCEESKLLASVLQKNLIRDLDNTNKREEKAAKNDYKVIRCYFNVPSVLIECGFLSNPREEVRLKDEKYQYIIAASISDSINEYFKSFKFCD